MAGANISGWKIIDLRLWGRMALPRVWSCLVWPTWPMQIQTKWLHDTTVSRSTGVEHGGRCGNYRSLFWLPIIRSTKDSQIRHLFLWDKSKGKVCGIVTGSWYGAVLTKGNKTLDEDVMIIRRRKVQVLYCVWEDSRPVVGTQNAVG